MVDREKTGDLVARQIGLAGTIFCLVDEINIVAGDDKIDRGIAFAVAFEALLDFVIVEVVAIAGDIESVKKRSALC